MRCIPALFIGQDDERKTKQLNGYASTSGVTVYTLFFRADAIKTLLENTETLGRASSDNDQFFLM